MVAFIKRYHLVDGCQPAIITVKPGQTRMRVDESCNSR